MSAQDKHRQELVDILTHGKRAPSFFKRLTLDTLDQIKENLDKAYPLVKERHEAEMKVFQEKQSKADLIRQQMAEFGLTKEDVFGKPTLSAQRTLQNDEDRKFKTVRVYKYKCRFFNRDYWWTGKAAMPPAFRCAIGKGIASSAQDFLLPEDQWLKTTELQQTKIPKEYLEEARVLENAYFQKFPKRKQKKRAA